MLKNVIKLCFFSLILIISKNILHSCNYSHFVLHFVRTLIKKLKEIPLTLILLIKAVYIGEFVFIIFFWISSIRSKMQINFPKYIALIF